MVDAMRENIPSNPKLQLDFKVVRKGRCPEFCAYLAIYPAILASFDYGQLASRPIRLFTGTLDEAIPVKPAERARSPIKRRQQP